MAFYLILIVMSDRYLTIYEIFANQIIFQKFHLENEDQGQEGEKLDLPNSTGYVRFYNGVFSEF